MLFKQNQFLEKLAFLTVIIFNLYSPSPANCQAPRTTQIEPMTSSENSHSPNRLTVVDIQSLDVKDAQKAIKTFQIDGPDQVVKCDVLIAGGGLGGLAAAHALTRNLNGEKGSKRRPKVCLLEETNWLGGQVTSQGVSALDENALVETSGASSHYLKFRELIRNYYLDRFSVKEGFGGEFFNPGNCWVSRLSFEPKVGLYALDAMLEQAVREEKLKIFHRTRVVSAEKQLLKNDRVKVKSLTAINLDNGEVTEFKAKLILDATELGDLLPLCGLNYRFGEEGKDITGEPHAAAEPKPDWVQDYIFPFVVEFCPDQNHTIEKPDDYEKFKASGQFKMLGYKMFEVTRKDGRELLPFWTYRRLIDSGVFQDLAYSNDIAMINWEANDVSDRNILDKDPDTMVKHLRDAKNISLGFLYWLQTEAPRDDGKIGYPELKLREDILQSADGMSKFPYIRESRRIVPEKMVLENDIGAQFHTTARARFYKDSVGIGHYPIDIHGPQEKGAAQQTLPFQIPLGSLIPKDAENLLPACKNIGVSHLANGSYRLQPVEWAVGTASGLLARESLKSSTLPYKIFKDKEKLLAVQKKLVEEGEPIYWFDDVPVNHPCFSEIQLLSMTGIMGGETDTLHFNPDKPISRQMVAKIISRVLDISKSANLLIKDVDEDHPFATFIYQVVHKDLMRLDQDFSFRPSAPLTASELQTIAQSRHLHLPARTTVHVSLLADTTNLQAPVTRAQFAEWIAAVIDYKKRWYKLAKQLREGPFL